MEKIIKVLLIFVLTLTLTNVCSAEEFSIRQWRVGYYESGPVPLFNNILKNFVEQLSLDGYFPNIDDKVFDACDSRNTWDALSNTDNGIVKFVKNAYWTNVWTEDDSKLPRVRIEREINKYRLDAVIIMGTLAAQRAVGEDSIVFLVMGASNVYESGIVKGPVYSGYPNVFATLNPYKYKQQLKTFHAIVDFKRLGIVYRDDSRGRSYAAVNDVEEMAKELGFELSVCFSDPEERSEIASVKDLWECYDHLSKRVDAMYITEHGALLNHNYALQLAEPFLRNGVPTLVQEDPALVQHGFLMAVAPENTCKSEGVFAAKKFEKIIDGETPGDLDMRFREDTVLYINTKVAEIIGFKVPDSILVISDKVYREIKR